MRLRVNFDGAKGEWFDLLLVEIKTIEEFISGTGWVLDRIIESEDSEDSGYGVVLKNTE